MPKGIKQYFAPQLKPSEVVVLNNDDDDVICLTPIEKMEVRTELKKLEEKQTGRSKYVKYSAKQRAEIGEFASKYSVSTAMKHFREKYPEIRSLGGPSAEVTEIGPKKRGRPSLLPDELMAKTVEIVKALRLKGAPVSYAVMAAVARGVVISQDRNLLVENGGHLHFSDNWARQIIHRVTRDEKKMVSRMGTTASLPVDPAILYEVKLDFQRKIKCVQEEFNITDDLILNFDQTPLAYICGSKRTMDFQGATSVPIVGKGKKQQITGTFTVTKSGKFLPMQLIYKGKTQRCLPKGINFPDGFDVTCTKNHWSNEEKCIQHLERIVVPYLHSQREELGFCPNQKALASRF